MTGQQLKNSILQMAVQGKLAPQDPNDEPASVLLEEIRKEKEQLVKEGKIKKEKSPSYIFRGPDNLPYEKVGNNDPVCIADEIPFEIPDSWEWVRLANICTKLVDGDHNPPKGEPVQTSFIMASSTNINNDTLVDLEKVRFLSETVFIKENERTRASIGDIFFTSVGSLGRSCVYQGGLNICFQRSVSVLTTLVYNYYLKYFFDSGYVQQKVFAEATGTAQKGFYLNQMAKLIVPIPPLSEQHRIVEGIRRILPLLTEYNKKEIEISALQSNFPDQLKKSILQEAIQGKLVPQDPNDEPVSVLLERIRAEKQKLIKEGKIKKDKRESVIFRRDNSYYEKLDGIERCIDDEIPFEIPESWEWVRFSALITLVTGTSYKKNDVAKEGIRILRGGNIQNNAVFLFDDDVFLPISYADKEKTVHYGDTIIVASTGSKSVIGKPAFINTEHPFTQIGAFLRIARPLNLNMANYISLIFQSDYYREHIRNSVKGTNINNIKSEHIEKLLVSVPPLGEQKRITQRLVSLFNSIDALRQ